MQPLSTYAINEKYLIRHAILKYLHDKVTYSEMHVPDLSATLSSLDDIAVGTKYSFEQIKSQHQVIPNKQAVCLMRNGNHCMHLLKDGIDAVINETWIEKGEIEYLKKQEILSAISTNDSVRRTNKMQKWILWLTAFISLCSLGVAIHSSMKDTVIAISPSKVTVLPLQQLLDTQTLSLRKETLQKDSLR